MTRHMRPMETGDIPVCVEMTRATGMFKPLEIEALGEVLEDYFAVTRDMGHRASVLVEEGRVTGYAYWAPAAMTDRTWYLYWIVVDTTVQGQGRGAELLRHAEDDAREQGGRLMLIETSGTDAYQRTRVFYLKNQYTMVARVPGYYAEGDEMCVFSKSLRSLSS